MTGYKGEFSARKGVELRTECVYSMWSEDNFLNCEKYVSIVCSIFIY